MYYYEVLVGALAYHGSEALTYSADERLQPGQIVRVALRARTTLGIVLREVSQPQFEVKAIAAIAPSRPLPSQTLQLMSWLRAYYPAPLGAVIRQFVPPTELFPKAATDGSTERPAQPLFAPNTTDLPPLSLEQADALSTITGPGTFLLHGVTGSGKSRVYVELAARAIANDRSAIVLTPEIGLTAQLTETFRSVFSERVFVLHSQLTAAQRRTIWYSILDTQDPVIVIGPRSALFSPVQNVGVVVLDESHDNAYKNESAPHYHAVRVAARLAQLHDATFVLGSATPAVEDYYLAQQRSRPIVAMRSLAQQSAISSKNIGSTRPGGQYHKGKPTDGKGIADTGAVGRDLTIELVDLRSRESFTRSPLLSNTLLNHIATAMQRSEQSLLFLNRRGTANVVLCDACGWQSLCPNCDLSLTYHGDEHLLRCHICGFSQTLPAGCPVCGNADILFKSIGTKAVVAALQKLFPTARIQRFDTDAKKSERIEQNLYAILQGSVDIIVGTQMVGKGLDLPGLGVVGIVNADSSLLIPDYTAAEQTYQLVSQVVGRVGRGHRAGTVVVQTYNPTNTTLLTAINNEWGAFYSSELAERRTFQFPPFVYLLKLRCLRASSKAAETAAAKLAEQLTHKYPAAAIEGPAPSFHPRERGKYSWQLLVKSPQRQMLVDIIRELPSGWSYDIDPVNLL